MKKTLALLLCLAMLFTALTVNVFAAENPTVTIVTSSVSENGETSFAIKFAGYTSLKGYDLVIKAGTGLNLLSASALNAETDLAEGVNYKIENNKLHIVELTKVDGDDIITVDAKFAENQTAAVKVEVIKCDLAESSSQLYAAATIDPASIAPYVAPKNEVVEEAKEVSQPADEEYFIPYGSVYDANGKYIAKDAEGKFAATVGTKVDTFKVPANGFGTFGTSDSVVSTNKAKQFGNVDMKYSDSKKYGTLIIVGEWSAFKASYLSNKAYSDTVLVEKIYAACKIANEDGEYDFVWFEADNGAKIKVYDVAQKNYMWKSTSALEYAVRVYGLKNGAEYAAVAYNIDGETVNVAKEIKSVSYSE